MSTQDGTHLRLGTVMHAQITSFVLSHSQSTDLKSGPLSMRHWGEVGVRPHFFVQPRVVTQEIAPKRVMMIVVWRTESLRLVERYRDSLILMSSSLLRHDLPALHTSPALPLCCRSRAPDLTRATLNWLAFQISQRMDRWEDDGMISRSPA